MESEGELGESMEKWSGGRRPEYASRQKVVVYFAYGW